jgi:hypothetical protein
VPLLQFLAYYQVIEFYFPVYSEHEARRRRRYVLKDPVFDPQSDAALGRLLATIDLRRTGGYGSERDQREQRSWNAWTSLRSSASSTRSPGEGISSGRDSETNELSDSRRRGFHERSRAGREPHL